MAKTDDSWSIETPPRIFSPKRQKTEPEVSMKIQYKVSSGKENHILHVLLLQAIVSASSNDVKVLNKRGEILKESVIPALIDEKIYANHYVSNIKTPRFNSKSDRNVITIHRFRGFSSVNILKREPKIMEFLRTNNVHISKHEWQEEDWDLTTLGFFTTVYPSVMPTEYATKVVSQKLRSLSKTQKLPLHRIKPIPLQLTSTEGNLKTKAFGIEVKISDAKVMNDILRNNLKPGDFVPFKMKSVNPEAYNKAIKFIASKNDNTWTILIKYMSDGSFFKLENSIKLALSADHIVHNPITKTARVLVPKKHFHERRDTLKTQLATWIGDLDPEDTREFNTPPEVSHISKDDYSSEANSFYSNSVESIMTFEVEEISFRQDTTPKESVATTTTTPSDISMPPAIHTVTHQTEVEQLRQQVNTYQNELKTYTDKLERMYIMLESLIQKINENHQGNTQTSQDAAFNRRH
jgi:hypothetical protein